jgi:hypothetical protein
MMLAFLSAHTVDPVNMRSMKELILAMHTLKLYKSYYSFLMPLVF